MKKILMWLGGIVVVLLVVAGALFGYLAYAGRSLDASSKAYVDETVPSIVASWSKAELLRRASPELRKLASDDQLELLFSKLSQLGGLHRYEGSKGDSNISLTTQAGKVVTAAYVANAQFEKGPAQITIRLIQHDGQWRILAFHVNSPLFLR